MGEDSQWKSCRFDSCRRSNVLRSLMGKQSGVGKGAGSIPAGDINLCLRSSVGRASGC